MTRFAICATTFAAVTVLCGCGGAGETSKPSHAAAPTPAQPERTASGGGLTQTQFGALRLRTPREQVLSTAGKPLKVHEQHDGTECLEYKALDGQGQVVQTQRYKLCFNSRNQLSVVTATPILK